MRRILLALVLAVVARPALADFTEGQMRYLHGDFLGARLAWTEAAEQGDARALYGLGVLYWRGLGVEADAEAAATWFARAARRRFQPAVSALSALAEELGAQRPPLPSSGYGV